MSNTSKVEKKYVGLLANVVNYTKMFTNETENENKRVALTLQTIRFDVCVFINLLIWIFVVV